MYIGIIDLFPGWTKQNTDRNVLKLLLASMFKITDRFNLGSLLGSNSYFEAHYAVSGNGKEACSHLRGAVCCSAFNLWNLSLGLIFSTDSWLLQPVTNRAKHIFVSCLLLNVTLQLCSFSCKLKGLGLEKSEIKQGFKNSYFWPADYTRRSRSFPRFSEYEDIQIF